MTLLAIEDLGLEVTRLVDAVVALIMAYAYIVRVSELLKLCLDVTASIPVAVSWWQKCTYFVTPSTKSVEQQ